MTKKIGIFVCRKAIKRLKNYHENSSLGMDALAKHVEKDESAKCGLIFSYQSNDKGTVAFHAPLCLLQRKHSLKTINLISNPLSSQGTLSARNGERTQNW